VKILRYVLVHDSGKIINPLLADANLHGGITQGIGGAMYEELAPPATHRPPAHPSTSHTPTSAGATTRPLTHPATLSRFPQIATVCSVLGGLHAWLRSGASA
jgi:xanthine dehydrogenase molybdopterin-binding subunit B